MAAVPAFSSLVPLFCSFVSLFKTMRDSKRASGRAQWALSPKTTERYVFGRLEKIDLWPRCRCGGPIDSRNHRSHAHLAERTGAIRAPLLIDAYSCPSAFSSSPWPRKGRRREARFFYSKLKRTSSERVYFIAVAFRYIAGKMESTIGFVSPETDH